MTDTPNTTDLPADLRARAVGPSTDYMHRLMRDAADEIERLRSLVTRIGGDVGRPGEGRF